MWLGMFRIIISISVFGFVFGENYRVSKTELTSYLIKKIEPDYHHDLVSNSDYPHQYPLSIR